jgi:hypothetical protein
MTSGERRFALRLEEKLEADYLCSYDVSIGEKIKHPDFVVAHPSRGLLMLEVKDWKLDTIQSVDMQKRPHTHRPRHKAGIESACASVAPHVRRHNNLFECDPQLIWSSESLKEKPSFTQRCM